ncbi:GGDEF domain-containing protein [Oxalobacteraceae bacterium OM1]|nr:GGDEF domain-containing protein [Oxalobacteraceae bacterium OM1]
MFLDDVREPLRSESLDRRKFLPARSGQLSPISLVSLLYALSLYLFFQQGAVSGMTFIAVAAVVVGWVSVFYAAFRAGINQRFADTTLLVPQIVAALATMLGVAYLESASQVALVPFVLIAFSFAIFRLSTRSLVLLALAFLGSYLCIIALHANHPASPRALRMELMQWCVLTLSLPGLILVGKQIQSLRQLLRVTRTQLEHYEEKSVRDELTGLYNRRQIQIELARAMNEADARGTPFAICLIDVDCFKEINDRNGHLVGDAILREFARVASTSIRDTDVLGRYGGDEFIQILPDTDIKGAVMHAERLRVRAHFLDFGKMLEQKSISLSIGVAQYRRGDSTTDLIARADAALYQAKQLGRNRVEWSED